MHLFWLVIFSNYSSKVFDFSDKLVLGLRYTKSQNQIFHNFCLFINFDCWQLAVPARPVFTTPSITKFATPPLFPICWLFVSSSWRLLCNKHLMLLSSLSHFSVRHIANGCVSCCAKKNSKLLKFLLIDLMF